MKRQESFGRPVIGMFLVLLAGLFTGSCAMAQMASVRTEIKLDVNACTASFNSTTCRGGAIPNGDICVAKGPNTAPPMIFQFQPPFPATAKIKEMDIGLNQDGSCPTDVADDFPAFSAPGCAYVPASQPNSCCSYSPNPAGNTLQILNKNKHERVWFYYLTLELPGCSGDIVIHPLIENGGNN